MHCALYYQSTHSVPGEKALLSLDGGGMWVGLSDCESPKKGERTLWEFKAQEKEKSRSANTQFYKTAPDLLALKSLPPTKL